MSKVIVTTSWDDGYILDIKLAELLMQYGFKGTFYLAPQNREFNLTDLLTDDQVKDLAQRFEIGSHTMTHPVLTKISLENAKLEFIDSKRYLEDLIIRPVISFCYPRGAYNTALTNLAKDAGYLYARTVKDYELKMPVNLFKSGTSIETHRLPIPRLLIELLKIAIFSRLNPIKFKQNLNWEYRAINMFDKVYKNGGVFHLWGHSWVIEREGSWDKLERVLQHINSHSGITYLANGDLVRQDEL